MPTVLGVFTNRSQAERAVAEIRSEGITQDGVSIVAREGYIHGDNNDTNDSFVGTVRNAERGEEVHPTVEGRNREDISDGTATGGAIGGVAGLLAGAGMIAIPGIGPILALGPIVSGLAGAAVGGLAGSLVDMGISPERGDYYQSQVERGGILAAIECDQMEINDVAAILRRNGARDVETY